MGPIVKTMRNRILVLSLIFQLCCSFGYSQKNMPKLVLQMDKSTVTVSPTLYGLMTEEINYSYEGGLYGQLVRNPSFKEVLTPKRREWWSPAFTENSKPTFWTLTDSISASMALD